MRKGWFKIPGIQDGDRTVEQQLRGLDKVFEEVPGKSVLDLGCAEGLIGNQMVLRGAREVFGMEVIPAHVDVASKLQPPHKMRVVVQDLNDTRRVRAALRAHSGWDICLMLAILHKLRDPLALVSTVVAQHRGPLIVIRTAERSPGYIKDSRSGNKRIEFDPVLQSAGYKLREHYPGPFNEWTGYYRLIQE